MAENKVLKMEDVKAGIEKAIKDIATFVKAGEIEKAIAAEVALKGFEKQYIELYQKQVFKTLCEKENPIVEAITMHSFKVPSHSVKTNDDGVMTHIETSEKDRQIDLLKFCKYADLDTDWQYTASRFNQLLCLRAATELGYSKKDIEKLATTYFLEQKAREVEMGGTPTSNSQLVKLLQTVIDGIVYQEKVVDGKPIEENAYKCNNHDVAYLLALYTKKGKGALSVQVAKNDFLRRIIATVLHRIITNGKYSVEGFKENKKK
ncbi:MAG: hypothetical protein IKA72_00535 [Clostridia bacterium]|nr:hypothetical protein [Clostridia bacterium]